MKNAGAGLPALRSLDLIPSAPGPAPHSVKATLKNTATGETHELLPVSIIGRSPESQVVVPDAQVSRRHAMIRFQDGGFYLFDLGSFNGSYLSGSRVTTARQLQNGDLIRFADNEFEFRAAEATKPIIDFNTLGGSTIAMIRSMPVIILVSDVIGFTSLSEDLPPSDLAQLMGRWYGDCETILTEEGGTVDKFIGDSVLAYWTKVDRESLLASLRAAKRLLATCDRAHEERPDLFENTGRRFKVGVALHTGKVAYGGMSQGEFTLVGDPVNLAFRIESLTRSLGYDCLLSGEFLRALPEAREWSRGLGVHTVRGRAQAAEVFGLLRFPE